MTERRLPIGSRSYEATGQTRRMTQGPFRELDSLWTAEKYHDAVRSVNLYHDTKKGKTNIWMLACWMSQCSQAEWNSNGTQHLIGGWSSQSCFWFIKVITNARRLPRDTWEAFPVDDPESFSFERSISPSAAPELEWGKLSFSLLFQNEEEKQTSLPDSQSINTTTTQWA